MLCWLWTAQLRMMAGRLVLTVDGFAGRVDRRYGAPINLTIFLVAFLFSASFKFCIVLFSLKRNTVFFLLVSNERFEVTYVISFDVFVVFGADGEDDG